MSASNSNKSSVWMLVAVMPDTGRSTYWTGTHFSTEVDESKLFGDERSAKHYAEGLATKAHAYRITLTPGVGALGSRLVAA